MGLWKQPLNLKLLVLGNAITAAVVAWWYVLHGQITNLMPLACLLLLGVLGGACKVEAVVPKSRITMGFTATYFAFLELGMPSALLVCLGSTLAACAVRQRGGHRRLDLGELLAYRTVFNVSNGLASVGAAACVFELLGGRYGDSDLRHVAIPSLFSALAYYLVNATGVTLAVAWTKGLRFSHVFKSYCGGAWAGFLTSASISVGAVWALHQSRNAAVGLLFLPPAFLVYYLFLTRAEKQRKELQHLEEQDRLNEAIITSLAMAIDAKDQHTSKHTNRVREYAIALAQKLKISADELQAVRIASLLHDIGKIGIPESILCKPGKLTPEEFVIIQSHVEIGAAILEQIQFPWPVVPIVRGHHERWDGQGYPARLKGEEIPVGARIISLVDVYDALTSERPYRRAMPQDQALKILQAGSGTQFAPDAVEAFLAILPELEVAVRQSAAAEAERALPEIKQAPAVEQPQDEAEVEQFWTDVEGLQVEGHSPGEILASIGERLGKVIPYSTLALFLKTPDGRFVVPAHTGGLWTPLVEGMHVQVGEGISGWVAGNDQAVRNAHSSLDLGRRVRPGENLELNAALSVPVIVGGQAVGALTLYHQSYNFYQEYHQERLVRLSGYLSAALREGDLAQSAIAAPGMDSSNLPGAATRGSVNGHAVADGAMLGERLALALLRAGDAGSAAGAGQPVDSRELIEAVNGLIRDGAWLPEPPNRPGSREDGGESPPLPRWPGRPRGGGVPPAPASSG